jgi:DNA-binding transcriptional MerR regulator
LASDGPRSRQVGEWACAHFRIAVLLGVRLAFERAPRPTVPVMSTDHLMRRALDALAVNELDGPLSIEVIHSLMSLEEVTEPLTVAEAADALDLSAHTLRYYERIGLVVVPRDANGNRSYDAAAMRRLVFLTRMRLSGMAIRDLQHYVDLVDAGDDTIEERLEMLLEHRDTIRRQLAELTLSLAATEYKIATYGGRTQL